jgi:hypothetical protein
MDLNMNTCGFKLRKWGIGLDVCSVIVVGDLLGGFCFVLNRT